MPGEEESFSFKHIDKKILQCYNERGLPTEIKETKEDVQMDTNIEGNLYMGVLGEK